MGSKILNILKFLIGTIIVFFTLVMIALTIDSVMVFVLAIIAPVLVYFFNKNVRIKSGKYFGGLIIMFIVSCIVLGVFGDKNENIDHNTSISMENEKVKEEVKNESEEVLEPVIEEQSVESEIKL